MEQAAPSLFWLNNLKNNGKSKSISKEERNIESSFFESLIYMLAKTYKIVLREEFTSTRASEIIDILFVICGLL